MQGNSQDRRKKDKNNPYEILKTLLDDFAYHCSEVYGGKSHSSSPFDQEGERQLMGLLTEGLTLEGAIQHRVLETMIVVIKELELWDVPQYRILKDMIVERFKEWRARVLSGEELEVESMRRGRLERELRANKAVLSGDR